MTGPLSKALAHRSAADAAITKILREKFPVGTVLSWSRNGIHEGEVILHGYDDRVQVRNGRSGKVLWIRAHDIVDS